LAAQKQANSPDPPILARPRLPHDWAAAEATGQLVVALPLPAPYQPGAFYLRELPPLLAVLSRVEAPLAGVVVDGYVWLGGTRLGLGARLYDSLGNRTPVVGVAKTAWGAVETTSASDACRSIAVRRGQSDKPLFVTAAGMDVADAAAHVGEMHGPYRIPTLLRGVDRLVRSAAAAQ
jgi:deoxyribonuclease V